MGGHSEAGSETDQYRRELPEPCDTYVQRTVLPALQVALEDLVRIELQRVIDESGTEPENKDVNPLQALKELKAGGKPVYNVRSYTDVTQGMGLRTTPPGGTTAANELLESAPRTLRYRQYLLRQLSSLLHERNALRKKQEAELAARQAADPRFRGLDSSKTTLRVLVCGVQHDIQLELSEFVENAMPQLRFEAEQRGLALVLVSLIDQVPPNFDQQEYLDTFLEETAKADILLCVYGQTVGPAIEVTDAIRTKYPHLADVEEASLEELQILTAIREPEDVIEHRPQSVFYIRGTEFNDNAMSVPDGRLSTALGAPTPAGTRTTPELTDDQKRMHALLDQIRDHGRFRVSEQYDPLKFASWVVGDVTDMLVTAYSEEVPGLNVAYTGHNEFADSVTTVVTPRADLVAALDEYADTPDGNLFFVSGEAGMGKSTALVHWVEQYAETHPDTLIIRHYASACAAGRNVASFALNTIHTIRTHFNITSHPLPLTPKQAMDEFGVWLALASEAGKVLIVIDDAHVFSRGGSSHKEGSEWLFPAVPQTQIAVVASTPIDSDIVSRAREANVSTHVYELTAWSGEEKASLVEAWREHFGLEFTPKMRKRILNGATTSNPSVLVAILHELADRGLCTDAILRTYVNPSDAQAAFAHILQQIEKRCGKYASAVGRVMSLLTQTRVGLAPEEIAEQLELPGSVLWRLFRAISPWILTRPFGGSECWSIPTSHGIAHAAELRYHGDETIAADSRAVIELFRNLPPSPRVLLELPSLLLSVNEVDDAVAFVCGPDTFPVFYADPWYAGATAPGDVVLRADLMDVYEAAGALEDIDFTGELVAAVERLRANVILALTPPEGEEGGDGDESGAPVESPEEQEARIQGAADLAAAELYQLIAAFLLETGELDTAASTANAALTIHDEDRQALIASLVVPAASDAALSQAESRAKTPGKTARPKALSRASSGRALSVASNSKRAAGGGGGKQGDQPDRAGTPMSMKSGKSSRSRKSTAALDDVPAPEAPPSPPHSFAHAAALALVAETSRRQAAGGRPLTARGTTRAPTSNPAADETGGATAVIEDDTVVPGDDGEGAFGETVTDGAQTATEEVSSRLRHAFDVLVELVEPVLASEDPAAIDVFVARVLRVATSLDNVLKHSKNHAARNTLLSQLYEVLSTVQPSTARTVVARVRLLLDLAEVQLHLDQPTEHTKYVDEVLELVEQEYGAESYQRALLAGELCTALATGKKKDYTAAREELETAATITSNVAGPRSQRHAAALDRLASFLSRRKKHEEALLCAEQLVGLRVNTVGESHSATAEAWSRAAHLTLRSKRVGVLEEGVSYGERALAVCKELHGEEHASTAHAAHVLGLVQAARNNLKTAAVLFDRALKVKKAIGANPADIARSRLQLAYVRARQGQFAQAILFGQSALSALTRVLGTSHRDTKEATDLLDKIKEMSKGNTG